MGNRGRKPIKQSVPIFSWVMVELLRDRHDETRRRGSAREASDRLATILKKSFLGGGRDLPAESIRRFHKDVQRSAKAKLVALELLEVARARREVMGWDASVHVLAFGPENLINWVQKTGSRIETDGDVFHIEVATTN